MASKFRQRLRKLERRRERRNERSSSSKGHGSGETRRQAALNGQSEGDRLRSNLLAQTIADSGSVKYTVGSLLNRNAERARASGVGDDTPMVRERNQSRRDANRSAKPIPSNARKRLMERKTSAKKVAAATNREAEKRASHETQRRSDRSTHDNSRHVREDQERHNRGDCKERPKHNSSALAQLRHGRGHRSREFIPWCG